jgi:hypothetical protein
VVRLHNPSPLNNKASRWINKLIVFYACGCNSDSHWLLNKTFWPCGAASVMLCIRSCVSHSAPPVVHLCIIMIIICLRFLVFSIPGVVIESRSNLLPSYDRARDRNSRSQFTWGAHVTTRTAKSYCWIVFSSICLTRPIESQYSATTRVRFEPALHSDQGTMEPVQLIELDRLLVYYVYVLTVRSRINFRVYVSVSVLFRSVDLTSSKR